MLSHPSFSQLTKFFHLGFLLRSSLCRKALVASLASLSTGLLLGAGSQGLWKALGSAFPREPAASCE